MPIDYKSIPLGAQESPPDERDYRIGKLVSKVVTAFPDVYEIPYDHPIKSQGAVSSCVAFALSYCREIVEERQTGEYTQLSPGFIYSSRGPDDHQSTGMIPRQALKQLLNLGICDYDGFPENIEWPQIKNIFDNRKNALLEKAYPHRITAYATLESVDDIKTALLELGPVPIMISVYQSFYRVSKINSRVPYPTSDDQFQGYHEMTIIGWRDNAWVVLNSWGDDWGDNGRCYIPMNSGIILETWAITDKVIPEKEDTMQIRPCKITMVDYHHTVGDYSSADVIRKEHKAKGWGDIGYNMVILPDGSIEMGRDAKYSGAHDTGVAPDSSGYTMNQRSFGIACVGNFEENRMSEIQYQGLLKSAIAVHKQYGLSILDHHKHNEQHPTKCPGKYFPWARLMADLKNEIEGGNDVLDVAVLLYSKEDYWAGADVADRNGNCAIFVRPADKSVPKDAMSAKKLIVVGGATAGHGNEVLLSGDNRYDTAAAVGKYLMPKV